MEHARCLAAGAVTVGGAWRLLKGNGIDTAHAGVAALEAMNITLKPISQQVIVITGASSGIGLATAAAAGALGARLVLAARSEAALEGIVQMLSEYGIEAVHCVADVADRAQVDRIAVLAIERFGRIDTWVNNAGVTIYGHLEEVAEEDARRLFDINFWGVVNGSLAALPYLRRRGGALVNVGSELAQAVLPLQGMYAASKHAVKGFTDALRLEIELAHLPVAVALVHPTSTDTPFAQHARNYMPREPRLPAPRIDPARVADAILAAACGSGRDVKVGLLAHLHVALAWIAPRLAARAEKLQLNRQHYDEPPRDPAGALFKPGGHARIHGTGPLPRDRSGRSTAGRSSAHGMVDRAR
jgi:short-subunit dehydrogenase